MATRTETFTFSDLSGAENASPVEFALQGTAYSIDLTRDEQTELFRLLAPYVEKGRKLTGRARRNSVPLNTSRSTNPGIYNRIREWGRANGHTVAERGRPSKTLVEAYAEATGETVAL